MFSYSIGGRKKQRLGISTNEEYVELILGRQTELQFLNGFEHPQTDLITKDGLSRFNWGLIPSWVKTAEDASKLRKQTLNAVSETVFEKPSFRQPIRTKRCLIPSSGFFEWRHEGKFTYPHYISLKNTDIFFFAGIYDEWTDRTTGEIIPTYSILTTEANPLMAKIHNTKKRMPVILPAGMEKVWLDTSLKEPDIKELCKPLDQDLMEAYTINRIRPSQAMANKEEALQPFHYPELEKNELF
ncbi:MAG: SOS response-associated peptidase [Bacteroidales bacterium]|nr:SOS response-associated peptidase [Bacteroidales bacterium]